ncbi:MULTISPECIES: GNAT family N-acetyltransferase [Pacificibacter]|uniref:GNAT family N-acetyltransferase n=1 Tax=Pacificibacter TaxID=1042323 RepID=UPI001C0A03D6|nr:MULTISPECIES: GNAT family N-acetyltransferase [Pacificibacter]MBU2934921.1 GNAT family N-acetyltransferase [Pacificibacter marinus]MDO6616275.1 GNAT family N-acetyltransferase [Pacificibacter sp. 1_MG-2023]
MKLDHTIVRDLKVTQDTIEADRFTLRGPKSSDVGLLSLYASDKRVANASRSLPHPLPPGATEAFIARSLDPAVPLHTFIIDGEAAGLSEVLGVMQLKPLERDQSEVSFWVAPSFWGTGIASSALKALVAANPLGDKTMFAEIFQDNQASARVVTNAGFEYLGDAETFSVSRGARVPTWTYVCKLD